MAENTISMQIDIDDTAVDVLIEKMNRLVKLLKEAEQIISSLSIKEESKF